MFWRAALLDPARERMLLIPIPPPRKYGYYNQTNVFHPEVGAT